MRVTVVLDGAGLQALARRRPPRELLAVLEVLRRAGAGQVLVPSVVAVEALTGTDRDAPVNRVVKRVALDERLPLVHARAAASLLQGTDASAVDAVVAEAAVRTRAAFVVTSDPGGDLTALVRRGGESAHVVAV